MRALDIAIEYRTEKYKDVPEFREHLADEYIRQGRDSEAAKQLSLALPVIYELYGHDEARVLRLEQKLADCRARTS